MVCLFADISYRKKEKVDPALIKGSAIMQLGKVGVAIEFE